MEKILKQIITEGDLETTAAERQAVVDEKKRQIIYYINKNYCDSQTKLPHPAVRIENCMKECKIRIDPTKNHEKQAEDAVKKMRGKLMFTKVAQLSGKILIPFQYAGSVTNLIRSFGLKNEEWGDTHVSYTFSLTSADFSNLQIALNGPTGGGNYDVQMDGGATDGTVD